MAGCGGRGTKAEPVVEVATSWVPPLRVTSRAFMDNYVGWLSSGVLLEAGGEVVIAVALHPEVVLTVFEEAA